MAAVFHPIRTGEDRGERQAVNRLRPAVTGQCGDMDHFTCTVGAPIGSQKHIHRPRRRSPLDTPIRQIKGSIFQGQKSKILNSILAHDLGLDHCCSSTAPPTRQTGSKMRIAARVALCLAQYGIGVGDQRYLNSGAGHGIRQGLHLHMQPVAAGHGTEAKIRQDKPLGGVGVFIGVSALVTGRKRIDAHRLITNGLCQRQTGGHILVQRALHRCRSAPDLLCDVAGKVLLLPLREGTAKIAILNAAQQVAVTHAA